MVRGIRFNLVCALALAGSCGLASAQEAKTKEPSRESPASAASMTGCVDEQNGIYVLTKGPDLAVAATLQADGFAAENFAKHLGHTVTIRGTLVAGTDRTAPPLFKVRRIDAVSDTCQQQANR